MTNYENALRSLQAFLSGDRTVALIEGTNQYRKHPLAMRALIEYFKDSEATILFRVNSSQNAEDFLSQALEVERNQIRGLWRRRYIKLDSITIHVDTINRVSQRNSPRSIDATIVYPFESLGDRRVALDCLQDLRQRGASKILCVTWTDNRNLSWIDSLDIWRVTYHVLEEDPDYHERVLSLSGHKRIEDYSENEC